MQLNITGFSEGEVLSLLLTGLTLRKTRLETTIAEIQAQMGAPAIHRGRPAGKTATPAPVKPKGAKRGPMSEEAKARIVAAQKKRWAKFHKDQRAVAKAANGAPAKGRKSIPVPVEEPLVEEAVQ